ncbi:MAG: alcohol dehydrogenase catalytic domain-containing protein [Sedimentisphaerales bacterium]|nr:alcohol dehydrogenase catalytic domain-containing protein [Sedimentisphaerales bacterium]
MKAIVLTALKKMELREVPEPSIKKDTDVLLEIEKIGVCGSDVHYHETGRIGSQVVEYPFIVGHECAATVKAVGKAVTRVKEGDEVVVDPAASCHNCQQCRQGRENTCENLSFLGTPGQGNGCLCEYIVMPQESCYPTYGKITLEQGALCEPLAIGVYSVRQSKVSTDAKIAVLGSGPIGLSCMVAAQAENVKKIYMTDKLDYRVRAAKSTGAIWAGNPEKENIVEAILRQEPSGMDIVYECAGQQETLDEAVELLKPGGKLMLIGIPRLGRISFSIDKLRRKELTLINVRRQNNCTQAAIDLVASGRINPDFMVTHRYPLEETPAVFDMVAGYRDGVVKAMISV